MNDKLIINEEITKSDAIAIIQGVLSQTNLSWSIAYNPSTKSYSVFIAEDVDEDE